MKNIILILLIVLISSCEISDSQKKIQDDYQKELFKKIIDESYIVTRDGCQYLINTDGHSGFMAHKGDCTNKIHKHE